jgi:hypothetical protein
MMSGIIGSGLIRPAIKLPFTESFDYADGPLVGNGGWVVANTENASGGWTIASGTAVSPEAPSGGILPSASVYRNVPGFNGSQPYAVEFTVTLGSTAANDDAALVGFSVGDNGSGSQQAAILLVSGDNGSGESAFVSTDNGAGADSIDVISVVGSIFDGGSHVIRIEVAPGSSAVFKIDNTAISTLNVGTTVATGVGISFGESTSPILPAGTVQVTSIEVTSL